jgi:hypothetical protein
MPPELPKPPPGWEGGSFAGARDEHLRRALAATPAQRLAMLEEMLAFAASAQRSMEMRAAAVTELRRADAPLTLPELVGRLLAACALSSEEAAEPATLAMLADLLARR